MKPHNHPNVNKSTSPIWLQRNKTFIKIVDICGSKENNGLITFPLRKPVWLSLKIAGHSPRFLIGEIGACGGNFYQEIGYQASATRRAICNGGTSYEGGIPFPTIDDACNYLAQYFDVRWCDTSTSKVAKKVDYPDSVKPSSNFTPLEKSLASIATHLSDLLSKRSPSKSDFAKFYTLIWSAFGGAATVVSGRHAHLENSWSAHPGVYVVRKKNETDLYDSILYVGMTGKLSRRANTMSGRLDLRPYRWDPYRFGSQGYHYGYDRKSRKYDTLIANTDYDVDCFTFDASALAAPSFLEAVLLQTYAVCGPNRLPPANNAF
jgi:hypothetical protein